jgi:CBS domain-containing protein
MKSKPSRKKRTSPTSKRAAKHPRAKAARRAKPANKRPTAKRPEAKRPEAKKPEKCVRDVMTAPVFTVTAGQTASDVWAVMRAEDVRHAVVLRGRAVIGVISDRDLGGPNGGAVRRGKTVGDLMHEEPLVATAETSVVHAARLVAESRVGCLPVLEGNKLIGVVTRTDLLSLLTHGPRKRAVKPGDADVPRPPRLTSPNIDKHL